MKCGQSFFRFSNSYHERPFFLKIEQINFVLFNPVNPKQCEIPFSISFKVFVLKKCARNSLNKPNYVKWRVSASTWKLITISRNVLWPRDTRKRVWNVAMAHA